MKIIFTLIFFCVIHTPRLAHALDFEITEVIEVGPAGGGPLFRPVRWSPDGSKIAYFQGNKLMVADTLGNSQQLTELEYQGRNFEWISDSMIVLTQRPAKAEDGRTFRLSTVTLSGVESVLEEESTSRPGLPTFRGPDRTPSGLVYYTSIRGNDSTIVVLSRTEDGSHADAAGHHTLEKSEAGLAIVDLGSKESRIIIQDGWRGAVANPDCSRVIIHGEHGNVLLYDIHHNLVETIVAHVPLKPDDIGCGIVTYDFNAKYDLIAYDIQCDDGHYEFGRYVAIFDITEKQSHLLSPIVSDTGEQSPAFSPNGRFLSFISSDIGVCIVKLEVKP